MTRNLFRLQRQRGQQNRQLVVPATCLTAITAAKPQQSQHNLTVETCTSSTAIDVDDYASSICACKAIFTPTRQPLSPTEVRVVQEQDRALQQWIKHHSTSSSRFKPALTECTSCGKHRRHAGARPSSAGFATCRVRQSSLPGI